jgi:hypothetical protein
LTNGEVFFLIIGFFLGAATCGIVVLLGRHIQRTIAHRSAQLRHSENLAQKRARHLRSRTERATGKNGWELDVETVYAALFSENGFDDQSPGKILNVQEEQNKTRS